MRITVSTIIPGQLCLLRRILVLTRMAARRQLPRSKFLTLTTTHGLRTLLLKQMREEGGGSGSRYYGHWYCGFPSGWSFLG